MQSRSRFAALSLWAAHAMILAACGGGGGGSGDGTPPRTDSIAPTTTIDSQPAPLTPDIVASFTFSASEAATFEASLDGAPFTAATSPLNFTALAAGTHTLLVRARDAAGNVDATPARAQWIIALPEVDVTPPTTTIDYQPPILTASSTAQFMFSSSEMSSTFEASLDGGPYVAANTVPYELTGIAEGLHVIAVRARDAAGNVDDTPATAQWLVQIPQGDVTPPTTTIDYQPPPVSPLDSAMFMFSSSEIGTFECSLDSALYTVCPQFYTLTGLTDGMHTLSVRAVDAALNTDPTPATAQWIVATPAPETFLLAVPDLVTRSTSALFSFGPVDPAGTFEGSLDSAPFTTVAPGVTFTGLAQGQHTFVVRSRNGAGIVDPTPESYTWAVDRVAPSARIVFPTTVSSTAASSITVRGNANDAYGLRDVSVNGVSASTTDNFQTWRAEVPLVAGTNMISVTVTDSVGNVANGAATAIVTNTGSPIYALRGIDYDSAGDRLIVGDRSLNVIYSVTLDGGNSQVISPQTGNAAFRLTDLAADSAHGRALVIDSYLDALVAVDLVTGVRTEISPATLSAADTDFSDSSIIAVDSSNNRAFVTRPGGFVVGVDLATGVRTVITGGAAGVGPQLRTGRGLAYDDVTTPGTPRLLVTDGRSGTGAPSRVMAVDIATGDRSRLSVPFDSVGTGPDIGLPSTIRLDVTNNHALVLDDDNRQIVAVDLVTGNRSIYSADAQPDLGSSRGMAWVPGTSRLLVGKLTGNIVSIDAARQRSTLVSNAVGTGVAMNYPEGLLIEQREGSPASLLVTDAAYGSVTRVNLATGVRSIASGFQDGVGFGVDVRGIVDIVHDTRPAGFQGSVLALVGAPLNAIVVINPVTGSRMTIAHLDHELDGTPELPAVSYPRNLRLDAANNRVYFSDTTGGGSGEALYSIDLASGDRTTITSATRGAGPVFDRASNFVLDPSGQTTRAIVADEGPGGMFSVDLATGDRSVFLAPWAEDPVPGASVVSSTFFDVASSRLIATRAGSANNLFGISLATGEQHVISGLDPATGTTIGRGPTPYGAFALDVSLEDGVAFTGNAWIGGIFAIDLVTGDRVLIAR
jgi:hypothetical protein